MVIQEGNEMASRASPLVKPGQTMQSAGALLLQPTLCPWILTVLFV